MIQTVLLTGRRRRGITEQRELYGSRAAASGWRPERRSAICAAAPFTWTAAARRSADRSLIYGQIRTCGREEQARLSMYGMKEQRSFPRAAALRGSQERVQSIRSLIQSSEILRPYRDQRSPAAGTLWWPAPMTRERIMSIKCCSTALSPIVPQRAL